MERGTFQLLTTVNGEEGIELDYSQLTRLLGGIETSLSLLISTLDDVLVEPSETFSVNLTNLSGANPGDLTGVGTILDDEPPPPPSPSFSISDVTVNEADGTATFTVTRSGDTSNTDTVDFATADGLSPDNATTPDDYLSSSGTLTFDPSVASLPVQVTIVDDLVEESAETFFVNLSNPSIGTSISDDQGEGTILDNDGPASGFDEIYVSDIVFDTRLRGKGGSKHDERIVVTILRDADADGVDMDDLPVAGATVTVEVSTDATDPASDIATLSGTTDSAGVFTSSWLMDLPGATYTAEVVALTHATYVWNGDLDPTANDRDADGDGLPDETHSIAAAAASSTADGSGLATGTSSATVLPTFASASATDSNSLVSSTSSNDSIVLIDINQQPEFPTDDETTEDYSDDPLTDEEPADEGVSIDDETLDNLFAEFDESLMDDLWAV